MFANFKPQTVQKRTIVERKKPATNGPASTTNIKRAQSTPNLKPASKSLSATNKNTTPKPSPRPSPAASSSRLSTPPRRAPIKRKVPIHTPQPLLSSDDDSSDEDVARKRTKFSNSLTPDPERRIWITEADVSKRTSKLIHGAELVAQTEKKLLTPAFVKKDPVTSRPISDNEEPSVVSLRYPSQSEPERYLLVRSRESEGYNPLEDILQTIEQVCLNYFPASQARKLTDDLDGFPRRIKSAILKESEQDFLKLVREYNELVASALDDRTIPLALEDSHSLPLPLVERILSQCTSRTVSPHVSLLRRYENGGNNVYGELLPRFVQQIFRETNLNSSCVFLDLGSGVGNVVLQAALETGAESYGIEMMPNPCKLARAQAAEFKRRCALWGIRSGAVRLFDGDFTEHIDMRAVLERADVVLVNNQAFNPELNHALLLQFLDLKEGARIVSLKSFVPSNWEIKENNAGDIRNILRVTRGEYFSGSVSWTNAPGEYYVATKDGSLLKEWEKARGRGRRA